MLKRIRLVALVVIAISAAAPVFAHSPVQAACSAGQTCIVGSGNVVSESRSVGAFNRVELRGVGSAVIQSGSAPGVVVRADDNIVPVLTTTVEGTTLVLSVQPATSIIQAQEITFTVTASALEAVVLSGAGNIVLQNVATNTLSVTISGAGTVSGTGTATRVAVEVSGAGRYEGSGISSTRGLVSISGTGSVLVNASNELDIQITGVGSVDYVGNPEVTRSTDGIAYVGEDVILPGIDLPPFVNESLNRAENPFEQAQAAAAAARAEAQAAAAAARAEARAAMDAARAALDDIEIDLPEIDIEFSWDR